MNWIKTSDHLPEVGANGESEYVLAYMGKRIIPKVVQYSDGSYSKRGWWTQDFKLISFYVGRGTARRKRVTHWCKIELPKETTN